MEIIGLLSSIIGLITAIVQRKKIIELRYSCYAESEAVTVGKRFKRLIILAIVGVIATAIASGMFGEAAGGCVLGLFALLALYQVMAIVILAFASLWK